MKLPRTSLPKALLAALVLAGAAACAAPEAPLAGGRWRAWLDSPGGELPFGLEVSGDPAAPAVAFVNGDERLPVPQVEIDGRRVAFAVPYYDSAITATLSADGQRLDGDWRRTGGGGKQSHLVFHAVAGEATRFPCDSAAPRSTAPLDGRFRVDFESDDEVALAFFEGREGGTVVGTFMTTTGDYRYLAGCFDGRRLRLSVFDGAHAFLFDAVMDGDGNLSGDFWSRDSWHETWTARPDDAVELPDAFGLTAWAGDVELGDVVYPDLEGNPRSLADPAFAGKARILEVFGSWCPNCNDAATFLAELDRRYGERGLSIVGLAFEMTGEFERDAEQVRRYAKHHGLEFPILLAGLYDKDEASRSFPLIDRVRSYPTTIFLHGDGRVRAVHQGYSGPATGQAHGDLRARFESIVEELLAEDEPTP